MVLSTRFFSSSLREMLAGIEIAAAGAELGIDRLRPPAGTARPCATRSPPWRRLGQTLGDGLADAARGPVMTATLPSSENSDMAGSFLAISALCRAASIDRSIMAEDFLYAGERARGDAAVSGPGSSAP